eukprot:3521210-Rhodomonas_salina.3
MRRMVAQRSTCLRLPRRQRIRLRAYRTAQCARAIGPSRHTQARARAAANGTTHMAINKHDPRAQLTPPHANSSPPDPRTPTPPPHRSARSRPKRAFSGRGTVITCEPDSATAPHPSAAPLQTPTASAFAEHRRKRQRCRRQWEHAHRKWQCRHYK